jgi:hypothetical protein
MQNDPAMADDPRRSGIVVGAVYMASASPVPSSAGSPRPNVLSTRSFSNGY